MHHQGPDTRITDDCFCDFKCAEKASVQKKSEVKKREEIYLQLTVTFTVLVSGEAMSFKALHS